MKPPATAVVVGPARCSTCRVGPRRRARRDTPPTGRARYRRRARRRQPRRTAPRRPPSARHRRRRARGPPRRRGGDQSPGDQPLPRRHVAELERRGVAVAGGLGLWLEEVDRRPGGLRHGTKGKSTNHGHRRPPSRELRRLDGARGNIGQPPWDPGVDADPDAWVIETSSFQATDVASSPPLVVVTSLSPTISTGTGTPSTTWPTSSRCARGRSGADGGPT